MSWHQRVPTALPTESEAMGEWKSSQRNGGRAMAFVHPQPGVQEESEVSLSPGRGSPSPCTPRALPVHHSAKPLVVHRVLNWNCPYPTLNPGPILGLTSVILDWQTHGNYHMSGTGPLFVYINWFKPHKNPLKQGFLLFPFTNEENKTERDCITFLRSTAS